MATQRQVTFLISANIDQFRKGLDRAQKRFQRFGRTMQRTGRTMTRNITMPLAAAGAASVKFASDFETSLKQAQAQADLTSQEVSFIGDAAEKTAIRTGQATADIIEAYKFTMSAGLNLAESQETVEAAAEASAAGFGEQRELVRLTTTALQAYGDQLGSSREFMDLLVGSAQAMELEVEKLGPAVQRNVGIAKELDVGLRELMAGIGSVSEIMGDAQRGGRLFQTMLRKLLNPAEEARDVIKDVFGSLDNLHRSIRQDGLLQTMVTLRQRLEETGRGMEAVFTGGRGLEAALNFTNRAGERTNEIFAQTADTAGSTGEAFNDSADFSRRLSQAYESLQAALRPIGNILIETINPLLERFTDFAQDAAESLKGLSDDVKQTGLIIAGILGAGGPILVAIGTLTVALAAISWPVVLGVTAFVGVATAIASHWDTIVEYFTTGDGAKLWATIKSAALDVWEALRNLFESAGSLISAFSSNWGSDVTGIITKSVAIIGEAVSKIIDSLSLVINLLHGRWAAAWRDFKDVATTNIRALDKEMFLAMGSMAQSATAMTNLLTGDFKTAWEQFKFGWGLSNKYSKFIKEQEQKVREENKKTREAISQNGYGAFEPIIQGALDAAIAIKKAHDWWMQWSRGLDGASGRGSPFTVGQGARPASEKRGAPDLGFSLSSMQNNIEKARASVGKFKTATQAALGVTAETWNKWKASSVDSLDQFLNRMAYATSRTKELAGALSRGINRTADRFLNAMGKMAAGATTFGGVFKGLKGVGMSVLQSLADLATRVGRIAIGVGIAIEGIKKALQTLNPLVAIAAGAALIALGSTVRAALQKSVEGKRESMQRAQQVNDAMITSRGEVIEFHPDDNILAMKDFGALQQPAATGGQRMFAPINLNIDSYRVSRVLARLEDKRSR